MLWNQQHWSDSLLLCLCHAIQKSLASIFPLHNNRSPINLIHPNSGKNDLLIWSDGRLTLELLYQSLEKCQYKQVLKLLWTVATLITWIYNLHLDTMNITECAKWLRYTNLWSTSLGGNFFLHFPQWRTSVWRQTKQTRLFKFPLGSNQQFTLGMYSNTAWHWNKSEGNQSKH